MSAAGGGRGGMCGEGLVEFRRAITPQLMAQHYWSDSNNSTSSSQESMSSFVFAFHPLQSAWHMTHPGDLSYGSVYLGPRLLGETWVRNCPQSSEV
ncbi:hypothetical protein PGT21_029891 [Puccinia graminis f. sp. tritici]|uniref:Uncharacterized protein n=1 Tax=Puccinia graminis f. sp. tritici TaxID=56615 RepID=A0A5B0QL40_PUCGR|nr:hypothetical protein PGT21_029891 [Puccinia graminis f. sp. tritici]KAA1113931.1 hypothetical protein PGTUg99_019601 [Puccinia graminis f. sp. tritici]KAA1135237.1 hypothetical protein PGTUg99_021039 [Puccinia graminis f. sp. tritici]